MIAIYLVHGALIQAFHERRFVKEAEGAKGMDVGEVCVDEQAQLVKVVWK